MAMEARKSWQNYFVNICVMELDAEKNSNLQKQLTNSRDIRVRKHILYESKDQAGFSNTAIPKNKNFVGCLVFFLSHNVESYKQVYMKSRTEVSIMGRSRGEEENSSQTGAFLHQAWLL